MREIKFRGWSKRLEKWVFGHGVFEHKGYGICVLLCAEINGVACVNVEHESVGQFTGLKDTNGVEIYEGDVAQWCNEKLICRFSEDKAKFIAETLPFAGAFTEHDMWAIAQKSKVIGNIHENPELLDGDL